MAIDNCKCASTEAELGKRTSSNGLAAEPPRRDTSRALDQAEFHLNETDALLQAVAQQCALVGDNCDDLKSFTVTLEALADKGRLHASEAIEHLVDARSAAPRSLDNRGVADNATAIEQCAQRYFDELVRNPTAASLGLCLNDLGLKLTAEAENDLDCFGAELHKRLVEFLKMRPSQSSSSEPTLTYAGIVFESGIVLLQDSAGEALRVPVNDLARDDAMVARIPGVDALRIGIEFAHWTSRAPSVLEDLAGISTLALSMCALAHDAFNHMAPPGGPGLQALRVMTEKVGYLADRHSRQSLVGTYDEWMAV
ncbi:MAG: hypothetical protein JWO70_2465 [Betaproteobacteria bacterium]|nr:hypothetical protein [Betaproteobacteria bacterium]